MKIISTNAHGILDYLVSILLLLSPWMWDYNVHGLESLIPILLGVSTISISLMTDYEKSVLRIISMKAHLTADVLSGVFLAASPWIFDFKDIVYLPHIIFGITEIIVALLTQTRPRDKKDDALIET